MDPVPLNCPHCRTALPAPALMCATCHLRLQLPARAAERADDFVGRLASIRRIDAWLAEDPAAERILILVGGPGSGKSTLMAWLCGAGPPSGDEEVEGARQRIGSALDAIHFCMATSARTGTLLDPARFAAGLAEQLSLRVPGYGEELIRGASRATEISVRQSGGAVGTMIGVVVERLHARDPASIFSSVLSPLATLPLPRGEILVLVDALDEAELWGGSVTIGELLAGALEAAEAQGRLRFLVTTRPVSAVLDRFPGAARWHLVRDAGADASDVLTYTRRRFAREAPGADPSLVEAVAAASQGNFLYARTALDTWLPRIDELEPGEPLDLPEELEGIYRSFLLREYGSPEGRERWKRESRPLLGALGVAQERLADDQLLFILDSNDRTSVQDTLERCAPYLEGSRPGGPFSIYHQSFREFLFDPQRNPTFTVSQGDANARTAQRYVESCAPAWSACFDDYGIRHSALHLAEAARDSAQPRRSELVQALVALVSDETFQTAHDRRVGDPILLRRDLRRALEEACANDAPGTWAPVLDAAAAWRSHREAEADPGRVFGAAASGDLDRAERNLDLFVPEPRWRRVVLLVSAWLAVDRAPDAARALVDRLAEEPIEEDSLPGLEARVRAALESASDPELDLPDLPHPGPAFIQDILGRMRGAGASEENVTELYHEAIDPEFISQLAPDDWGESAYLGGVDGPFLVGFAHRNPDEGDPALIEYIELLAANGYVFYRNRSLWALLHSILRHPGQRWTRDFVRRVCEAALAGSRIRHASRLPLVRRALECAGSKERLGPGLEELVRTSRDEASRLDEQPGRGRGDTWGHHRRRLAALAEALAVTGHPAAELSRTLLDEAGGLPYGFAGFESPAQLSLAESCYLADPHGRHRIEGALDRAGEAAHSVQDPSFCARTTSRYNAIRRMWEELLEDPGSVQEVAERIDRFTAHPHAPRFSAVHRVGEPYAGRQAPPVHLKIPDWALQAHTLRDLARLYERPVGDFMRLNRDRGWGADELLEEGTGVAVPDPEMAPLVAAFLSAMAMSGPEEKPGERGRRIRSLIPLATEDPTALDLLLSRWLLADPPWDDAILERLPAEVSVRTEVDTPSVLSRPLDTGPAGNGGSGGGGGRGSEREGGTGDGFTLPSPP